MKYGCPKQRKLFCLKSCNFFEIGFFSDKTKVFFSTNPTKNVTISQLYGVINIFSVDCSHVFFRWLVPMSHLPQILLIQDKVSVCFRVTRILFNAKFKIRGIPNWMVLGANCIDMTYELPKGNRFSIKIKATTKLTFALAKSLIGIASTVFGAASKDTKTQSDHFRRFSPRNFDVTPQSASRVNIPQLRPIELFWINMM